jgi:hypothetical protein
MSSVSGNDTRFNILPISKRLVSKLSEKLTEGVADSPTGADQVEPSELKTSLREAKQLLLAKKPELSEAYIDKTDYSENLLKKSAELYSNAIKNGHGKLSTLLTYQVSEVAKLIKQLKQVNTSNQLYKVLKNTSSETQLIFEQLNEIEFDNAAKETFKNKLSLSISKVANKIEDKIDRYIESINQLKPNYTFKPYNTSYIDKNLKKDIDLCNNKVKPKLIKLLKDLLAGSEKIRFTNYRKPNKDFPFGHKHTMTLEKDSDGDFILTYYDDESKSRKKPDEHRKLDFKLKVTQDGNLKLVKLPAKINFEKLIKHNLVGFGQLSEAEQKLFNGNELLKSPVAYLRVALLEGGVFSKVLNGGFMQPSLLNPKASLLFDKLEVFSGDKRENFKLYYDEQNRFTNALDNYLA